MNLKIKCEFHVWHSFVLEWQCNIFVSMAMTNMFSTMTHAY